MKGGVESTRLPTSTPTETTGSYSNSKVPIIVGVVVGVICVALIVGLSAFFLIRRKNKRRCRGSSAHKPALLKSPKSPDIALSAGDSPAPTMFSGKVYVSDKQISGIV
jgi:hypothetical protein